MISHRFRRSCLVWYCVAGLDRYRPDYRLDSMANQNAITRLFLEAIDACPEDLQRDIISILPELVSEDDHEVRCIPTLYFAVDLLLPCLLCQITQPTPPVVQALVLKLKELCDGNGSFLPSALDAFSTLSLAEDLQVCITCKSLPTTYLLNAVLYLTSTISQCELSRRCKFWRWYWSGWTQQLLQTCRLC